MNNLRKHDFRPLTPGARFRKRLTSGEILPLSGIYDVFSALISAKHFEGVFCSGFSFSASTYGLPDIGYVNWRDISDFASRVSQLLPESHLLVDIDDGFGDETICASVVANLERLGVSAVMFEDQKRPRRCGHFEGKQILPVDEYVTKLKAVLNARRDLFVIARTDATDPEEGIQRAVEYVKAGADGVMVEAVRDLSHIRKLRSLIDCPIMLNQLHGGKSPNWTLDELQGAGVSIVIYSTPCLFAAQYAIDQYLGQLARDRKLPSEGTTTMKECQNLLASSQSQPNQHSAMAIPIILPSRAGKGAGRTGTDG
jgi:2-methylisocitrate lyase-like PEP mutase family enzyme